MKLMFWKILSFAKSVNKFIMLTIGGVIDFVQTVGEVDEVNHCIVNIVTLNWLRLDFYVLNVIIDKCQVSVVHQFASVDATSHVFVHCKLGII